MNKTYLALALVLMAGLTTAGLGSALAQTMTKNSTNSTSSSGTSNSSASTTSNSTSGSTTQSTQNSTATGDTFTAQGNIASVIFNQSSSTHVSSAPTSSNSTTASTAAGSANATTSSSTNATSAAKSNSTSGTLTSNTTTPASSTVAASSSGSLQNSSGTATSATASNGTSSSSNATQSASANLSSTSAASTSAPTQPWIAAGNFSLSVQSGKVSNLSATFVMVRADGTDRHVHEFKNFTQKGGPITLSNHTLITGTVDITKNGQDLFKGVYVAIMIENKSIASMAVDSLATQNHFGGQPIYAVFTSFKDKSGTDVLQSTQSASTATSSVGNALSSAGKTTTSFLGNASKSITGLFNKTK